MRKIDADELMARFSTNEKITTDSVRRIINQMPTVSDNKQGFWRKAYLGYGCSECNYHVIHKTKYCPDCGARMVEPVVQEHWYNLDTLFSNRQLAY